MGHITLMLHIITPVKDSIASALLTFEAIQHSRLQEPHTYTVYDDFSTPENAARLDAAAATYGFNVVHLDSLTTHPSPNYLLVLQREQQLCLAEGAQMLIVESDVVVREDTLQGLVNRAAHSAEKAGIVAAVTVDESGAINYPYGYAKGREGEDFSTRKHCSFCCSLLTLDLLRKFDFRALDATKNWFDVTISHESLRAGLCNVVCCSLPVLHRPHQSRPWKQLKYKNPLKYYWLKLTRGLDKI